MNTAFESQILQTINQTIEFEPYGVAYIGNGICKVLREPRLPQGLQIWIVLKQEPVFKNKTISQSAAPSSNIMGELIDVGINCTAAVLAGSASAVSAGAAPLTAGTSFVVTAITFSAAVASAAQCGISSGRMMNAIFDPHANDVLDSIVWFERTTQVLDVISIAGGVTSLGQTAKAVIRLSRTTGRPLKEIVKGMTRAERKRLAKDLAKYAGDATTNRQFVRLARAGKIPKIFRRSEVSRAIISEFMNSLSASLSLAGSAKGGVINVYFTE